jgi:hypothetical protein
MDTFADWQVPTWVMVLVVSVLTISLVIGVPLARMAGTRRGRRLAHPELLTTKRQKAADTALFLAALVPSVLVWLAVMGVSFIGLTGFAARVMNWTHWTNTLVPLSLDGISVSFGAWAFVAVKRGRHPGRAYKIVLAAATMSAILNFVHGHEEWSIWAGIYLAFLSFTGMAMFHELLEQFMAAYDEETALRTRYPRFGQRWLYAPLSTFAARRAWIVNPPREPLRPSIRNALEHLEYVREERRLYRLGGATRVREEQQARLVEFQARMQVKAARRGDAAPAPSEQLLEPPPPLPDPAGDVLHRLRKELAPQPVPPTPAPQLPQRRRPETSTPPPTSTDSTAPPPVAIPSPVSAGAPVSAAPAAAAAAPVSAVAPVSAAPAAAAAAPVSAVAPVSAAPAVRGGSAAPSDVQHPSAETKTSSTRGSANAVGAHRAEAAVSAPPAADLPMIDAVSTLEQAAPARRRRGKEVTDAASPAEVIEVGLVAGPPEAATERPKRKTKSAAAQADEPLPAAEAAEEGAPQPKRRTKAAAARAEEAPVTQADETPVAPEEEAAQAAKPKRKTKATRAEEVSEQTATEQAAAAGKASADAAAAITAADAAAARTAADAAAVKAAGDAEHERWRLEVPKSGWQRIGESAEGALAGLGGDGAVPLLFGASISRPVLPERVPQILDAHVRPGDDLSVVRLTNLVLRSLAVPANRDAVSGLVRTWVGQIENGTRGYLDGPRPTPEPARPFGPKLEYPFEVLTLQKVVINHRPVACPDCGTEESLMFSGQHKRRPVEASCGCGQRWPIVGLGSERVGEALANEIALGQAELLRT